MIAEHEFEPFNPHTPVRVYRRNLPHWRQEGRTYFVTFGQADSIPRPKLAEWRDRRERWLKRHGVDGSLSYDGWQIAFRRIPERERLAFQRSQRLRLFTELDNCHGGCLLRRPAARAMVEEALHFFHGKRCWSRDFVVMPNHVHWLISPFPGHELEDILGSVKGFTSAELTKLGLKKPGRFWRRENYDHIVRDLTELTAIRSYIAQNPVKARCRTGEYTHHRADWT
jgi:putative transposase